MTPVQAIAERIAQIDRIQGRRFDRLQGRALNIAAVGIGRHFYACDRQDVEPDVSAIREIIDDAIEGRAVYTEKDWVPRRGVQNR